MTVPGSETDETLESLETQEGSEETQEPEVHKTEAPQKEDDVEDLLARLEANKDKIPAERLQFLNPDLVSGFTRRLNLLNRGAEQSVRQVLKEAGAAIPEGKTALDLLTENDGKDFFKLLRGTVDDAIKPIQEENQSRKQVETVNQMVSIARSEFPEVERNLPEIIKRIQGNPDYSTLAAAYEGKALPYVMQAVGIAVELEKSKAKVGELEKLLSDNKIAVKVGKGSSKVSGALPLGGNDRPKGKGALDWALDKAMEKINSEHAS